MPYKIISLQAENFQRLTAVEIRPDSNVVVIGGENEAGKSSLLDGIWAALAGGRAIPAEPIRKGQETALLKLDLGEMKVTRSFKAKDEGGFTTALKVEADSGARFDKPQDVLNAILGELTFDPLAFTRMKPADQFDMLKAFVPGVDFHAIAMENGKDFTARTDLIRRAKELRAQADGFKLPPGAVPLFVDTEPLEKKLGEAANHNSTVTLRQERRERAAQQIAEMRGRADALRQEAAQVYAHADVQQKEIDGAESLPEPINVTQVQAALAGARQGNATADLAARKTEIEAQARQAENDSEALTKRMARRETDKLAAISAAKMPVHGVSFGDECVLLDGLPFEQGSTARRLRAGVEIAAALNPRLRVIRISEGSLLDKNAMAWLAEFAAANDLQIWCERVGDGGVGFIIEDGHLKGHAPAADETEEGV